MKYCRNLILLVVALLYGSLVLAQTYRNPDLPDALTFANGKKVKNAKEFEERRSEIKKMWCKYFIGDYPKKAPKIISSEIVSTCIEENGSTTKKIKLTLDTPNRKSFEITVWLPLKGGKYPLLLTQPRDYQLPWAKEALSRGYVVCLYPGLDAHHNEPEYPDYQNVWKIFKEEYPEASWSSSLAIQAWLASRALDFLLNPANGFNIDTSAVGIIGHSRYGKQSIYAAAFDERIKCVVARSSGTPTACSYRFASRHTFMESVHDYPDVWALESLKDYFGRENELPIEGNSLIAAIAPRKILLHTAYNDGSDPTFGVERTYLNAKTAYQLLGKPDNICLSYRFGGHNPISYEHVKHNIDFFDLAFGRGKINKSVYAEKLIHKFDWNLWKSKQSKEDIISPSGVTVEDKIKWMLGKEPAKVSDAGQYRILPEDSLGIEKWSRDRWNPGGLKRVRFGFSGKMQGNIYFDPERESYKGTVIWLHPWNYSHGSNEGYGVGETTVYWRLAKEGYICVGYDQFGFGDHLLYALDFYKKYPSWSLLGRSVYDVSRVIDFLIDGKGITEEEIPKTDPSKIYICGFSYGGMVALYASAIDERIKGVASFSGFTPMRTDVETKPTGGLKRLYDWHYQIPKLGLFKGKEKTLPYDYDDVIKLIAPRKVFIHAPLRDRFADYNEIKTLVDEVRKEWKDSDDFKFETSNDVCRFQKNEQDALIRWLKGLE